MFKMSLALHVILAILVKSWVDVEMRNPCLDASGKLPRYPATPRKFTKKSSPKRGHFEEIFLSSNRHF